MRVSVTELDALQYFQRQENGDVGELIARMRRQLPPARPMEIGIAFHEALEAVEPGSTITSLHSGGFSFHFPEDAQASVSEIRELKLERLYRLPGGREVRLVGKVDGLFGGHVIDHKFTLSGFDPERFMSTQQWRCYLDMFGGDVFTWQVYCAPRQERGQQWERDDFTISEVNPLTAYRYPGLHDDVVSALVRFSDFAERFLPERCEVAA